MKLQVNTRLASEQNNTMRLLSVLPLTFFKPLFTGAFF